MLGFNKIRKECGIFSKILMVCLVTRLRFNRNGTKEMYVGFLVLNPSVNVILLSVPKFFTPLGLAFTITP